MTTYWVSNARHWCKECKCWMDAKASSIRKHEEGFRHKGNVDRLLKKLKRDKILAGRESTKNANEIAAIERAAKKAYIKDCANGNASIGLTFNNKNTNRSHRQRKDSRLFLPSDNDTYYYMDKTGITHGPYSSFQMCKWYHFGFFVGALRIRKREQTEFIHLRDIKNPFSHNEFKYKFDTNIHFKNNIINSIDISNMDTIPSGIDIPETLKNDFYKLYPKAQINNKSNNIKSFNNKPKPMQHKYFSDGKNFKSYNNNNNNNIVSTNRKQQRRIFVRGQMRKYKSKCNCGDSDCHLKHNNNNKSDDYSEEIEDKNVEINTKNDKIDEEKSKKSEIETVIDKNTDELGFGQWETVTKAEFDKKHSNEKLFKQREKLMGKKRKWWRDGVNKNLPIAKRKKLMGIDNIDSDDERDFDNEYGINQILKWKQENSNNDNEFSKDYKQSKDKINISIGRNINNDVRMIDYNSKDNTDVVVMNDINDDNVMVKDAKMKLVKLKENEKRIEKEKKDLMIEQLNEGINDKNCVKNDKEMIDSNVLGGLFKKKRRKKKNRQNVGVVSDVK